MNTKTQLETTAGLTTIDLFQNDSAQGRVDKIRIEALAEVFDVSTAAGRKLCISQAGKVAKTKTAVDKLGKALSDSLNVERAKVMADRRIYNDGLSELKLEVRQPVTDWEASEVAEMERIAQLICELMTNSEAHNITGELFSDVVLQAKLEKLEAIDIANFGDQQEMAQERLFSGKTKIRAAIQQRKDADELAELRRLKAEEDAEAEKAFAEQSIATRAIAKHEAAKEKEMETASATEVKPEELVVSPKGEPVLIEGDYGDAPDDTQPKRTKLEINTTLIQAFCNAGGIEAGNARRILAEIERGTIENISINY